MQQSYFRSFVKDNAIVLFGHIFFYMYGLILMPIVIKTVGVTVYGGFVLLSSILSFLIGISSFGVGFRAKRFLPGTTDTGARHKMFYSQLQFGVVSIFVLTLLPVLFSHQLNDIFFKNDISYSPLIMPLYAISYILYSQGSDYFRYTSRIKQMTLANICYPYTYIAVVLLFFYCFHVRTIDGIYIAQSIAALFVAVPCFVVIIRELGWRPVRFAGCELYADIKLGAPLVLNFIVDFVLSGVGRYFIAFYIGVTAVGYFNPAYVLGSIVMFLPKAMGTVVPQLLSKAVDNSDQYEANRIVNYSIKIFLLVAIPFVFGSAVLAKSVLAIFADKQVAQAACWVTPIVAIGTLFYGLNILLSNVLFVRLKTKVMFAMNVYAAIFNAVGNCVLLYIVKSILITAVTMLFSYAIVFFYMMHVVAKEWTVDFDLNYIVKVVIASIVMMFGLIGMTMIGPAGDSIVTVCIYSLGGVLIYLSSLLSLRVFSHEELYFLKRAIA